MSLLLLLLLGSSAPAAPPVGAPSWTPITAGETVAHDDVDWLLFDAEPESWVRAHCPAGPAPRRAALHIRREAVTWVESSASAPLPTDASTTWLFAPTTVHGRWWALDRPDCTLHTYAIDTQADRLDHLERKARTPVDLLTAAIAAEAHVEHPELWPAEDPWARYLALHPAGGVFDLAERASAPSTARHLPADLDPGEAADRWWTPADTPWTVRGPARVRLTARAVGDPGSLCATVAGPAGSERACTWTEPLDRPQVVQGELVAATLRLEGRPVGRLHTWWAWVPAGVHTLLLDAQALVRVDVAALQLPPRLAGPERPHLALRPDADQPDDPVQAALLLDPSARRPTLFGPAVRHPPGRERTVWMPTALLPDGQPWWDDLGRASLLLTTTPGQACTLTLGDHRWRTAGSGGVHELMWLGDGPIPTDPPPLTGCEARVRVSADLPWHPDNRIAVTVTTLHPGRWTGVAWTTPPGPDDGRLWVFPEDDQPVHLRLLYSDGEQVAYTVQASAAARDGFTDGEGNPRPAALILPLTTPGSVLAVHTDRPVGLRLTAPGEAPIVPPPPEAPTWEAVAAASTALAEAPDDPARALALSARSALLSALDQPREAWADLLLAADLDPTLDREATRWRGLQDAVSAWAEHPGWTPVDPIWLPDDAHIPEEVLTKALPLAAAGDHLAVAERLRAFRSPLRWWLEAARTQPLDDPQARMAVVDLHLHAVDPEHPAFSPIRRWSRWQTVRGVRGVERTVAVWPAPPEEEAAPDHLFPEPWPERIAVPAGGQPIDVPPLNRPHPVKLRCRALQPVPPDGACRFRLRATTGEILQHWDIAPWGQAVEVTIPPSLEARGLDLVAEPSVRAELNVGSRWPAPDDRERTASVMAGLRASFEVHGPTVVRVQALRTDGGAASGRIWLQEQESTLLQREGELWTAQLVVPNTGTHTVHVALPPGTLLRASIRVPRAAPVEPPAHRDLIRQLHATPPPPILPPPEPTTVPPPPPPEPATELPLTVLAELSFNVGRDGELDPDEPGRTVRRFGQQLSVLSRPDRFPLWLSAELQAWEANQNSPVLRGQLGAEIWWTRSVWTVIGTVDLDARTAPGDPLTRFGTHLRFGLGHHPNRWFDWRLDLRGASVERFGEYTASDEVPSWLWNPYREEHRLTGQLEALLRAYPNPWLRLTASASVRSNALTDPQSLDAVGGAVEARLAQPGWLIAIEGSCWYRPEDSDRAEALVSPELRGRALATLWAHRHVALQWWGTGRWLPAYRDGTVEIGVRVLWTGREGLGDLRPSRTDAREAMAWGALKHRR